MKNVVRLSFVVYGQFIDRSLVNGFSSERLREGTFNVTSGCCQVSRCPLITARKQANHNKNIKIF